MKDDIKTIQEKLALYQNIISSLPEYLAYKNNDGVYEIVSNVVNDLYKEQFETIVGKKVEDIYSPKAIKDVVELDQEVYRTKQQTSRIFDVETADGDRVVDSVRTPIFNDFGDIIGILSTSRDISELQKLKQHLEEVSLIQKELIAIQKMFVESNLHDFPQVMERSLKQLGNALHAKRAYIVRYHFKENAMSEPYQWNETSQASTTFDGIQITDLLEDWVHHHRDNRYIVLQDKSIQTNHPLYSYMKQSKLQSLLALPIMIKGNTYGFIGFDFVKEENRWYDLNDPIHMIPDIYASFIAKQLVTSELEKTKITAQKATNVQSDFIAKMTHEIKTPINGVTNSLYLLQETEMSEEQQEYLDIMTYSLNMLGSLVQNILDYSKIEVNKMKYKSTDIHLEHELIKLLKAHKYMANNKGIGLYLDYDYRIPTTISTDIEKIRQIVSNLVQNAIKYTNYGHVMLKTTLLSYHPPYTDVLIEVIDTGIGISPYDCEHIFDEFYQVGDALNKKPDGTGLGLTIAHDLVDFLKGELLVTSTVKAGSNFHFELTFYSPIEEQRHSLDTSVLFIDLSLGAHSNILDLLQTHFATVHHCNERNYKKYSLEPFDFIILYINDFTTSGDKMDKITTFLTNNYHRVPSILLFDFVKNPDIMQYKTVVRDMLEYPEQSDTVIDKLMNHRHSLHQSKTKEMEELMKDKPTLLLVDDNRINRKVMAQLLKKQDIDVFEAENGFDAIEQVKKDRFDIIFMDIIMPGIDGFQTARKIRELGTISESTPIIAVSANDVSGTKQKAAEFGMNDVLAKPLKKEELLQLLEHYLGTSQQQANAIELQESFNHKELESFYEEPYLRKEIIQTFLQDAQNDFDDLRNAFASNDCLNVYNKVHYLKGSFTYLCAKKLQVMSDTIMRLCKQDMTTEVLLLEESYMNGYKILVEELKEYADRL